jgi:leader peptidase (prepilin peptidase)/N-methyltransferase
VQSLVVLVDKCLNCGRKISLRYPSVELITGLLFFYFVWTLGPTLAALKMCVFAAILVALIFSDLEKRILPDELTLGGTLLGLVFAVLVPPVEPRLANAILWIIGIDLGDGRKAWIAEAGAGAALPAFFLWGSGWLYEKVRHREGLGFGDVKLIALVGSFLGIRGALLTLILGSISGSILGYGYIKATGKDASTYPLPFGTFLGVAALAAALAKW